MHRLFLFPQWQAQTRDPVAAERLRVALLSGYAPPPAYTHVNVAALMQQTAAAISRWAELQQALDVESDTATANLAAQAQTRSALRRDLTDLTQLADAQTKHVQRAKMRHTQALQTMQAAKPGVHGGGSLADMSSSSSPLTNGAGVRPFQGGSSPGGAGDTHGVQQHLADFNPVLPHSTTAHNTAAPPPTGHTGQMMGMPGSIGAAVRGSPSQVLARQGLAEDPALSRSSDWPVAAARPVGLSESCSPPLPSSTPPQAIAHATSAQQRLREIKSLLERSEPRSKWAVLVEASLGLLPHESATYKHLLAMAHNYLKKYNGVAGAEIAQALWTCMDPRVFNPEDITRSQKRMADIYSQWTRRTQR